MNKEEKKQLLLNLQVPNTEYKHEVFYKALQEMDDLIGDYSKYFIDMDVDKALELTATANYELCCALLTLTLREDYWSEGSFEERYKAGQVMDIVNRMIELLE